MYFLHLNEVLVLRRFKYLRLLTPYDVNKNLSVKLWFVYLKKNYIVHKETSYTIPLM